MSAGKTVRQFGRLLSLAVIGSVLIAGVDWTAPNNWAPQDKSLISFVGRETGIAQARYIAPSATSDSENGVCVIYFNPPPASPANSVPSEAWVKSFTYSTIRRWSSQFTDADGRWATPKVEERTINGLPTTVIDTSGRYFPGWNAGWNKGASRDTPERMLGAVIRTRTGQIAVKFAGPAKTIAANKDAWESLLGSFKEVR